MTRGGGGIRRPEGVFNSIAGSGSGVVTRGWAVGSGGGVGEPRVSAVWEGDLGGKRGVVLAVGGAPVRGGADGLVGGGWVETLELEVSFETLGMGLVTAVDQAGGTFATGAGSNWLELCIGSVVAAETFGRGVGVIFVEAGLRGRGGRLMRSVSRLGAFGSDPGGVGASAIFVVFIVISEKVQW
jgi:hypothetical protein